MSVLSPGFLGRGKIADFAWEAECHSEGGKLTSSRGRLMPMSDSIWGAGVLGVKGHEGHEGLLDANRKLPLRLCAEFFFCFDAGSNGCWEKIRRELI